MNGWRVTPNPMGRSGWPVAHYVHDGSPLCGTGSLLVGAPYPRCPSDAGACVECAIILNRSMLIGDLYGPSA